METLDLRRIFINDEGQLKAAFVSFVPNQIENLTIN
jgi:hypothetical protein